MGYPQFYLAEYDKTPIGMGDPNLVIEYMQATTALLRGVVTWEISCIGYIGEWPADCGKAVNPA